jgi:hypothetical protein
MHINRLFISFWLKSWATSDFSYEKAGHSLKFKAFSKKKVQNFQRKILTE